MGLFFVVLAEDEENSLFLGIVRILDLLKIM